MHFLAALFLFADLLWLSQAKEAAANADRDTTILLSTDGCSQCPDQICSMCTLGTAETLHANASPEHPSRILLGFSLPVPAYQITKCTLDSSSKIVFFRKSTFDIDVLAADASYWDEETVTSANAPAAYQVIDTVTVGTDVRFAGPMDLTRACQAAGADGRFSVYLAPVDASFYLYSKEAGWANHLVIEYEE